MIVRLFVRLTNRDSICRLVHATRFEPVIVDAKDGVLAFDLPFRRVESVLDQIARNVVGEFLAHLTPISKIHDAKSEGV